MIDRYMFYVIYCLYWKNTIKDNLDDYFGNILPLPVVAMTFPFPLSGLQNIEWIITEHVVSSVEFT